MATVEEFSVSLDEWPQLQALASKAIGITISADTGEQTEPSHGILVQWDYDRTAQLLTLTEPAVGGIEGHFVSGHVKSVVEAALGQIRSSPISGQPAAG